MNNIENVIREFVIKINYQMLAMSVCGGANHAIQLARVVKGEPVLVPSQVGQAAVRHGGTTRRSRRHESRAGGIGVVGSSCCRQIQNCRQSQSDGAECLFEGGHHVRIRGEM